ncbi:hypothetical protein CAL29_01575 [Bordetella genomosp. 10]|uniref:HTH lysR-type domain-containing protein n=1 Tax=Bordetella genomosp. 10 TaxID=1416804 RepID=A0A261SJH1_9BORD|nr:LysR family transcriptional regulator [Bordetella genomosp. 10]OZI37147.1 hypothetical protein CAL29_01575 [Bordetella genomosp. 10]
MELRHLRYFVAVAEEENVTRAAKRLQMRQPPLTQQIQILERELGVQLFHRSPRKITLNDSGRVFLDEALRLLKASEQAIAKVRIQARGCRSMLRVGLTTSALLHERTQALLHAFRLQYPDVEVRIEDGATLDLLNAVDDESLDVALIRTETTDYPGLESQRLADEPLVVAMPSTHRYTQAKSLNLADLHDEEFILPIQKANRGMSGTLIQNCEMAGFAPRVRHEPRRTNAALGMVATGMGIAVVAASVRSFPLQFVTYRPLAPRSSYVAPLNLVSRREARSPALAGFLGKAAELAEIPLSVLSTPTLFRSSGS